MSDDEELEAVVYYIPVWDCPNCGEVNDGFGEDDLTGRQKCESCGEPVEVRNA